MQEQPIFSSYIPRNESMEGTLFGIEYIRWIEVLVLTVILCYPIVLINFVLRVKVIAISVIVVFLMLICFRGYKNRNLSYVLYMKIKHYRKRKKYHLRSVKNEKRKTYYENLVSTDYKHYGQKQSHAEKLFEFVKEKFFSK